MQNRFKFRFLEECFNKVIPCDDYDLNEIFNSGKIVMQCTGLKDKNGKLIYEGDIVNGTCGVYWGKMIVKFNENEAKFYMYRIDKRYTDLHFHGKNQEDNFELEVIGNAYENPELLEE